MVRYEKLFQYFPFRRHSFLQCDRMFGTSKRKVKKIDRIYTPDDFIDLIKTSKNTGYIVRERDIVGAQEK